MKTSWILKSAFLAPSILGVLQSCREEVSKSMDTLVLGTEQNNLVCAMADTIIPRTTTPSASDVKVNLFIDLLLADVFDKDTKERFLVGLDEFNVSCFAAMGNYYQRLTVEEQHGCLSKVDENVMGQEYGDAVPFYYTFKHLVITSYFSTEEGIKQNLNYTPVPGPYIGELTLKEGDKITVGNKM